MPLRDDAPRAANINAQWARAANINAEWAQPPHPVPNFEQVQQQLRDALRRIDERGE